MNVVHPCGNPDSATGPSEGLVQEERETDLGQLLDWLVAGGALDPGGPAYGVALVAVGIGYNKLTRAQKRLYDRDVLPLLPNARPQAPHRQAQAEVDDATGVPKSDGWRPMREAPQNGQVQLAVLVDGKPQPFAFPCRQGQGGWINAITGRPLFVKPSRWRDWSGVTEPLLLGGARTDPGEG